MPNRKSFYYGPQDVEIRLGNSVALICSSQYSGVGSLYVLCSNYNQVGNLARVVGSSNFSVTVTHKENAVDIIHVNTFAGYSWFILIL